ncbi:hypothetical protein OQI_17825 [Streptomyces pharetrae CZA14]|uniref:Uncharacterized protein n=1 Tax=Streptomyces pharetrae CZA14 TaxID=1144883 RepID=A0ABX3YIV6_9ACTN|nr:hypothetical protein OQI_17825 [Streptomyces pharetrae CZA14]
MTAERHRPARPRRRLSLPAGIGNRYAVESCGLSYTEVKDLERAPLEYAFLPGDSLWCGGPPRRAAAPSPLALPAVGCPHAGPGLPRTAGLMPRGTVQWRQEAASTAFEETSTAPAKVPEVHRGPDTSR